MSGMRLRRSQSDSFRRARADPAGNDRVARHNHEHFRDHDVVAINLMGSPGAGKTAVLTKIDLLEHVPDVSVEVIERNLSCVMPVPAMLKVSTTTGEGIDRWIRWLRGRGRPRSHGLRDGGRGGRRAMKLTLAAELHKNLLREFAVGGFPALTARRSGRATVLDH